jgi:hypothetical protein
VNYVGKPTRVCKLVSAVVKCFLNPLQRTKTYPTKIFLGPIFRTFFPEKGKISGKIPRKIFPLKNVGKKWNFPQKKFQKIVFPRNSTEFSTESDFPWKKMYEKSAPGANPKCVSNHASFVKIYIATNSLASF